MRFGVGGLVTTGRAGGIVSTLPAVPLVRASIALLQMTAALVLPFLSTGCGGNGCDRTPGVPPIKFDGGDNPGPGFYESAPVTGPYLDFPGGRTYRFVHHLGGVPTPTAYFSFDEYPGSAGFVQASGNQATYTAVTSEYIDVRNDTCSDVRIRVTAEVPVPMSTADAGP